MNAYKDIDDYIAHAPEKTQAILQKIRETIHETAPEASEKISYGIPTFYLKKNLIHFGGYEEFVSLYPGAAPIEEFKEALKGYKTSKGTVQFPLNKPIPYDLIRDITLACVQRNLAK